MGDKGVVDPLAHTAVRNRVRGRVVASDPFATEVVVRMDGHDDGDLRAFWDIGQPKGDVHQGVAGESSVLFAGRKVDFDEVFLVGQSLVGAVHGKLCAKGVHGQIHGVAQVERCVPPFGFVIRHVVHRLTDGGPHGHGEKKEDDGDGDGGAG